MNYASKHNLTPADRIVCPWLQTGLTKHHAIYLGYNEFGQELIAENHLNNGVQIVTTQQFELRNPVITRIEKFQGNYFQRNKAVRTAIDLKGMTYDLFTYNCEHYANQVQYGASKSTQVTNFLVIAGLVIFGLFLNNEDR